MSERRESRKGAVAGAILVALGVAGLWYLLGDASEEQGSKSGTLSRTEPAATRPSKPAPFPRSPRAGAERPESSSEARMDPRPEGVLELEVLSGDTPLPGARVQIYQREPADLVAPLRRWSGWNSRETEADGRWVVPAAPGSYYVTARAEGLAPGYAAVVHPPGSVHTRVQLRLEAAAELRGTTVVKGTGDPVSLAEIILTPPTFEPGARDRPEAPEEESATTTSNESGEFQLPGLAPGRYRVEARAPGYVSAVLPSVPIPFGARITLELIPGGQLEGVVLRASGEPADGAEVLAISRESNATTLTDDEGRFTLTVPAGTFVVSARKGEEAGALDREVKLAVGQRAQGLRLQLGAGARVSGKVAWWNGSPIPGARVEARSPHRSTASGMAHTDERGSFALSGLTAGTYDFRVTEPGSVSFEHGPVTLAAGENPPLTLSYDPRGNLNCEVRDTENHPVENVLVRVSDIPIHSPSDRRVIEARTQAQGTVLFKGLPAGWVRVQAFMDAHPPSSTFPASVGQDGTRGCLIRLPGGAGSEGATAKVEGQVLEPSGATPVAPVVILASRQKPSRGYGGETSVDRQGHFRLDLTPGQYLLSAIRQHSVRCGGNGRMALQTEAGQHPEATIRLEPMREPDLRLQVLESDGTPARLTLVSVSTPPLQESVRTDDQGRLDVCLSPESRPQAGAPLLIISSSDGMRMATIEQANGQRDFVARLAALPTLRGRIIAPSSIPVRRVTVNLSSPYAWIDAYEFTSDRFALSVPPGQSELLVTVHGTLRASVVLDLRPEEHKDLEIPVFPDVPLTGRLVDAATRHPIGGVSVYLSRLKGADTAADGRFTFNNVPAGDHLLQLHRKGTRHTTQLVKLLPGQANDVGDIAVP